MAFDATTTTDEVLAGFDLTGTTALVTGGYRGLGRETTRALVAAGADVTIAGRDEQRMEDVGAELAAAGPGRVDTLSVDLASHSSVRSAADRYGADHDRLDLLINNAGVMGCGFERSVDGHEMQLATNHLGHFILTARLAPLLLAAAPSRIVILSSAGHRASDIVWDDPDYDRRPYDKWAAYGQSKTANVLHAVALQARLGHRGVDAFAVMPGMIFTALGRHLSADDIAELTAKTADTAASSPGAGASLAPKSVEAGAATTVWCATAPELAGRGGVYCEDCRVAQPSGVSPQGLGYEPYAVDPEAADRLWALSEELTGETS